ncbi:MULTISPECIES: DmsE family decaheme c-type cytochrome [Kordiimonas]|uniref:DmsE family decaheme c-type cytochrome n=1 Tax=Kordiimonas TaxID=288021 RepID=UPI00257AE257|nr:DmsE family decaheme c-type cytochrome [Kordiimonas sp. UBA4487]
MAKLGFRSMSVFLSSPVLIFSLGAALFIALAVGARDRLSPQPDVLLSQSRPVGMAVCADCHTLAAEHWAHTVHARPSGTQIECESCHGPGSAHIQAPDDPLSIVRFSRTSEHSIQTQNGQCLACHDGGKRLHWHASVHETADLACSDCHNPMASISGRNLLARESVNDTCMMCHRETRIDFNRRSHMPLFEGKVGCLDCHNPHGSAFDMLLHTPTVNETCYSCHAEKRGPFLFEHAPVSDNCLTCHSPHGSNHEKLLVTARPLLCQQCHSMSGHINELITSGFLPDARFPDPRLVGRSCQNCHSQIHGSNHPAGSRLQR